MLLRRGQSYAAKYYPFVFEQATTSVLTVLPERTFWEKATILHHEANRPKASPMPMRYSRHYYDLFCMANSSVKEDAFADLDLLKKVVDFKMKFEVLSPQLGGLSSRQARHTEIVSA